MLVQPYEIKTRVSPDADQLKMLAQYGVDTTSAGKRTYFSARLVEKDAAHLRQLRWIQYVSPKLD